MERATTADGIAFQIRPEGSRRPVVFVHGALDRSASFLRVARALEDRPVLLFDRRGYGRSVPAGSTAAAMRVPVFEDHVRDLDAMIGLATSATGRRPLVVGHSLGGAIALLAAARGSDSIAGLLSFEAPLLWEPWWPGSVAGTSTPVDDAAGSFAERFMRRLVGDQVWEALPERTRQQRRAEGPILESELRTARGVDPPDLSAIEVPVLVAAGSELAAHRQRAIETLVAQLPRASSRLLEDAPHNAHSACPERFAALVEAVDERALDTP